MQASADSYQKKVNGYQKKKDSAIWGENIPRKLLTKRSSTLNLSFVQNYFRSEGLKGLLKFPSYEHRSYPRSLPDLG